MSLITTVYYRSDVEISDPYRYAHTIRIVSRCYIVIEQPSYMDDDLFKSINGFTSESRLN